MKKLTSEDLRNLKHGDVVYRFKETYNKKLYFVGKDPKNENALIFCDGEYIERLYINKNGEFNYDWYDVSLTSEDTGDIILSYIDNEIVSLIKQKDYVKEIYFKK